VSILSGGPAKAQCLTPHTRSSTTMALGDHRKRRVRIAFTSICRRATQVLRTIVQFAAGDCSRRVLHYPINDYQCQSMSLPKYSFVLEGIHKNVRPARVI